MHLQREHCRSAKDTVPPGGRKRSGERGSDALHLAGAFRRTSPAIPLELLLMGRPRFFLTLGGRPPYPWDCIVSILECEVSTHTPSWHYLSPCCHCTGFPLCDMCYIVMVGVSEDHHFHVDVEAFLKDISVIRTERGIFDGFLVQKLCTDPTSPTQLCPVILPIARHGHGCYAQRAACSTFRKILGITTLLPVVALMYIHAS